LNKFLLITALLLVASFSVNATDAVQALEARAAHLQCNIVFTTAVLSDMIAAVPEASTALQPHVDKLNTDSPQLESLAAAGSVVNFASFTLGMLWPDLTAAHLALVGERLKYNQYNVTADTRTQLRTQFNTRRDEFSSCQSSALIESGRTKVTYLNGELARWEEIAANLTAKGADMSEITSLISGARTQIVTPLQAAVDSGDSAQVQAALKQYCLANGCRDGTNFHFYAKADLARLVAITNAVEANATAAGKGDQITAIRASLTQGRTALDSVGPSQYPAESENSVWTAIRSAGDQLRVLLRQL